MLVMNWVETFCYCQSYSCQGTVYLRSQMVVNPLPNKNILDLSKLKAFADKNSKIKISFGKGIFKNKNFLWKG